MKSSCQLETGSVATAGLVLMSNTMVADASSVASAAAADTAAVIQLLVIQLAMNQPLNCCHVSYQLGHN